VDGCGLDEGASSLACANAVDVGESSWAVQASVDDEASLVSCQTIPRWILCLLRPLQHVFHAVTQVLLLSSLLQTCILKYCNNYRMIVIFYLVHLLYE